MYSVVVGKFVVDSVWVFSVVMTNNVGEFLGMVAKDQEWEEMVRFTFSRGVLFLNEKEAAWEAYRWAKEDRVSSVFVDFGDYSFGDSVPETFKRILNIR
jgi:hypothetical protein